MRKQDVNRRMARPQVHHLFAMAVISSTLAATSTVSAQNWVLQHSSSMVHCIRAVNEHVVWAGARSGVYLKTVDGGANWTLGLVPAATNIAFFSVIPFNQDTAYFLGGSLDTYDSRIYKTIDGGKNWLLQYRNTKPGVILNAIGFWDENNGIAFSDPVDGSFLIITTSNGGASWEQVPPANIPAPLPGESGGDASSGGTALVVQGAGHAWFGTSLASPLRVFRTTDRGRAWTVSNTPLSTTGTFGISTLAFRDSLNGFVGGGSFFGTSKTLAQTADGGQTWTIVSGFLTSWPATIVYVPNTNFSILVATTLSGSGYSLDGGVTWKMIGSDDYTGLSFVSPTTGWATSVFSRAIVKFSGNLATAVEDASVNQPQTFSLAQNSPNPLNTATTIVFSLPKEEYVILKVYDLAGQEMQTLIKERRAAGRHEARFDTGPLSSGLYLYRLQAGDFVATRKMTIVK